MKTGQIGRLFSCEDWIKRGESGYRGDTGAMLNTGRSIQKTGGKFDTGETPFVENTRYQSKHPVARKKAVYICREREKFRTQRRSLGGGG